ncbi:SCO family protein [Haloarchaeobius iranensis]|uniref:Protein SCO1/2 n=1 Tax=Haloarchaeobius iranensis TaxID=996166 RepID=A0A1G9YN12_9EURY|nr:SCO family protein [Haloarchaeobius iranensis]SDN10432.1 protein SCO1/2 [Haloarchaeobius iranensis]
MQRRTYLAASLGLTAASAGCLTSALGGTEGGETVLDPPADQQYDSSELPYPAHGQALPDFELPDPLAGEVVESAAVDGTLVVTAFFATCPVECVRLIGQLAGVQQGTVERGIEDEVTFLAITFDPERDDAATLREYGQRMNIDMAAGNWRFLRPASPERAETVVDEKLGVTFDRIGAGESQRLPGYDFRHLSLTFLRNPDGTVERAYRTDRPDHKRVLSDVQTVVEATA